MANAQRVDPRVARQEQQNDLTTEPLPSIAAGVSWMLGIASIPLIFAPPAAIVTGFLAIVFGHIAKSKIKRIPELTGETTATNGLLMGYLCFFAALALLPSIRMQSAITDGVVASFRGVSQAEPGSAFEKVERNFLDSESIAMGNSDDARKIATALAKVLNDKREEAFLGSNAHQIRTLCQQNDQGICMLVLIPDIADFDSLAHDAIVNLSWKESQRLAFGTLPPGRDFSVAVRDRIRYHSMEFGRATKSPDRIAQPDSQFVDVTMLAPFFDNKPELKPELGEIDAERR